MRNKFMAHMGMVGDLKTLEEHYAKMARKGWMIDEIGLLFHRYKECEPSEIRFFVDLLPQIGAFDYPEGEEAQNYREMCEQSGWRFVAASNQLHIFCAEEVRPSPVPIHTDNKIQAKIHLAACRKYEMPIVIFFVLMMGLLFFVTASRGAEGLLHNITIFSAAGAFVFVSSFSWHFGFMVRWYLRTLKCARKNLPMPAVNYGLSRIRNHVLMFGITFYISCLFTGLVLEITGGMHGLAVLPVLMPLLGLGAGFWVRKQVDTKQRSRKTNILKFVVTAGLATAASMGLAVLAIAVIAGSVFESHSLDGRPALLLSHIGITAAPERYSTRIRGSVAVPMQYGHWEMYGQISVSTDVYRAVNNRVARWLYAHLSAEKEERLAWFTERAGVVTPEFAYLNGEQAARWGAEEGAVMVHSGGSTELLLRNGRTILQIRYSEGTDPETIRRAVGNLWRHPAFYL